MDERLEKALEFSNYRMTIENQKKNLKVRIETLQTIHFKGGTFKADATTISFVHALVAADNESAVLVDQKGNPVEIEDLKDFQEQLVSSYNQAMNEYHVEYKKLSKARNIKKIMDW